VRHRGVGLEGCLMELMTLPNRLTPSGDLAISPTRPLAGSMRRPERTMTRDAELAGAASTREQIERATDGSRIRIGEAEIVLSDLNRVLWPPPGGAAVTKRDFLRYLVQISPVLLPFLRDRPVEVTCCPNGIDGESLWQLDESQLPAFAETVAVWPAERE